HARVQDGDAQILVGRQGTQAQAGHRHRAQRGSAGGREDSQEEGREEVGPENEEDGCETLIAPQGERGALRYLVIDTPGWLSGRKVLLSTAWLSSVEPGKETVVVNMEKKRIKESPPYESGA